MLEHFAKRPFHLALYRNGPYAAARSRFLAHLVHKGRCFERLQRFNWFLLEAARKLDLSDDRRYTRRALMTVAVRWQRNRYPKSQSRRQSRTVILGFVFVA